MRKVIWVDGGVSEWRGGSQVDAAAREWVFEDGEEGKVVAWVCGAVEDAGVGYFGWCAAARQVDFLDGSFGWGEQFLKSKDILQTFAGRLEGGVQRSGSMKGVYILMNQGPKVQIDLS